MGSKFCVCFLRCHVVHIFTNHVSVQISCLSFIHSYPYIQILIAITSSTSCFLLILYFNQRRTRYWHFRKWICGSTEVIGKISITSWYCKRCYDEKDHKCVDNILRRHFPRRYQTDVSKRFYQNVDQILINGIFFFVRDLDLFKNSLSKAVCDTYALESMIYLTAGIIDGYENADVDMETAIIKVRQTLEIRD